MFVGRRADGSIYGSWTVRQADDSDHPGQEELPDDHPDVLAFVNYKPLAGPSEAEQMVAKIMADPEALATLKAEFAK